MELEEFCKNYNLGDVKNITKLTGGFMHKMFKVETTKGIYAVKVLNEEVMKRKEAYNNFVVSEVIANLAKDNGIVVASAQMIDGNYLTSFNNHYYMVFDFVDGKVLTDEEIEIEHCKKIGNILARIHDLDYSSLGLENNVIEYKMLYDWKEYSKNPNFVKMSYRKNFLENYSKYNSILLKANERFNAINKVFTICHRDMDPKNVMWRDNEAVVIDWESASLANPYRELVEDALCWSGFLTNQFNEDKFRAVFLSYAKIRSIQDVDWYSVIFGNLVGRFGWLKYNLERSLGICSNDSEERKLAEIEVEKTIDEINRYLELIETMNDIITSLVSSQKYSYKVKHKL